ncbi:MAG: hypothetical protein C4K58_00435 [Flavobacteriaceae bacterium]|nr:MAG: hypothetical protein C4K58_00435 [Flavobacteriaceae bacterium]
MNHQDFFQKHKVNSSVEIKNHLGENRIYAFPTVFTENSNVTLIFTADAKKVAKVLPNHPNVKPLMISKTRCLFLFVNYLYGNVTDNMVGYNETIIGPMFCNSSFPVLPMIAKEKYQAGVYALDLPVDNLENCNRGVKIWNLPKNMKNYQRNWENNQFDLEIRDDSNQLLYRISAPLGGKPWPKKEDKVLSLSVKDGNLLTTNSFSYSEDMVYYTSLFSKNLIEKVEFEIGDHPLGRIIKDLDLSEKPIVVRSAENISSALDKPVVFG